MEGTGIPGIITMNLIPSYKSVMKYIWYQPSFFIETFYRFLLDRYHLAVRYRDS